jgi:hypothetical protein
MVATTGSRDEEDKGQDSKRSEADFEFIIGDTTYLVQAKGPELSRRWTDLLLQKSFNLQSSLGYVLRQQAVQEVAKADPNNIQEVAASQLSIINSYYQSGLQQSQQSFKWSLIWGGIGLGFLIGAISFLLLRQPTEVAIASGIGGAFVELFAGTYLYPYKHASDQLAAFRISLESTQRLLLANSMCGAPFNE